MSYQPLYIKELKTLIQPSRYDEFIHFIRTGEASSDFLKYMEEDPLCQEAIEKVLDHQAKVFAEIGKQIREIKSDLKEEEKYESSFWMDVFTGIAMGMAVTIIIFFLIF